MSSASGAHIKGSAILGFVEWYGSYFGREAVTEVAATANATLDADLDTASATLGILPTRWYPAEVVHLILDGLSERLSATELDAVCHDAAEDAVEKAMSGLFKAAFDLLVTPERYAKYIQRFWNRMHDTGVRRIDIVQPGFARSYVTEWPGHHPHLCQLTMQTMGAVFRRMGCRDVRVIRVQCVSHGAAQCQAAVRWDP